MAPRPQPFQRDMSPEELADFYIFAFKTQPCTTRRPHEWKNCCFYHAGEKARRRDPSQHDYAPDPCIDFMRTGACSKGDTCPLAHGVFETWLHPDKYCTVMCCDGPACKRKVCWFAHSLAELRALPPGTADGAPATTGSGIISSQLSGVRHPSLDGTALARPRTPSGLPPPQMVPVSGSVSSSACSGSRRDSLLLTTTPSSSRRDSLLMVTTPSSSRRDSLLLNTTPGSSRRDSLLLTTTPGSSRRGSLLLTTTPGSSRRDSLLLCSPAAGGYSNSTYQQLRAAAAALGAGEHDNPARLSTSSNMHAAASSSFYSGTGTSTSTSLYAATNTSGSSNSSGSSGMMAAADSRQLVGFLDGPSHVTHVVGGAGASAMESGGPGLTPPSGIPCVGSYALPAPGLQLDCRGGSPHDMQFSSFAQQQGAGPLPQMLPPQLLTGLGGSSSMTPPLATLPLVDVCGAGNQLLLPPTSQPGAAGAADLSALLATLQQQALQAQLEAATARAAAAAASDKFQSVLSAIDSMALSGPAVPASSSLAVGLQGTMPPGTQPAGSFTAWL